MGTSGDELYSIGIKISANINDLFQIIWNIGKFPKKIPLFR